MLAAWLGQGEQSPVFSLSALKTQLACLLHFNDPPVFMGSIIGHLEQIQKEFHEGHGTLVCLCTPSLVNLHENRTCRLIWQRRIF